MASARGRKTDATGRSLGGERHVRMDHWMLKCPAYRALKPGPRALLGELLLRFNGSNNGRIGLGVREAAEAVNVASTETVSRYFHDLQAAGFIVATRRSGFNLKALADRKATEWALTWLPIDGQAATKDFMRERPSSFDGTENPIPKNGKSAPTPVKCQSFGPVTYGKSALVTPIQQRRESGISAHI